MPGVYYYYRMLDRVMPWGIQNYCHSDPKYSERLYIPSYFVRMYKLLNDKYLSLDVKLEGGMSMFYYYTQDINL